MIYKFSEVIVLIEKLFDSYDNSLYFLSHNIERLAEDNLITIRSTIYFISCFGLLYLSLYVVLVPKQGINTVYTLPAFVLLIAFLMQKYFYERIKNSFIKVRVFALIFYGTLILAFSFAEIYMHRDYRCFCLPASILIVSALYMDFFHVMLIFRLLVSAVFILIDFQFKSKELVMWDITWALIATVVSCFCYFVVMRVNTNRVEANRALEEKSQTDLLTGLFNKISFEERSREYLSGRILGAKATLFIFDFDNFKNVNDNYGHKTGDEALKKFAGILKDYFHSTDVIGRVGGDEFMVLVMGEMPDGFIDKRCRNIQHELRVARCGDAAGFSCSIGICEDTRANSFDDMYKIADSALYDAKENGKACHVLKKG